MELVLTISNDYSSSFINYCCKSSILDIGLDFGSAFAANAGNLILTLQHEEDQTI